MTLVETGVMEAGAIEIKNAEALSDADIVTAGAVSYTHLTLPTSDLV